MIPLLPKPSGSEYGKSLIRHYTDDGVVVTNADRTQTVQFPYLKFAPCPTSEVFAAVVWEEPPLDESQSEDAEPEPFQFLALMTPGKEEVKRLTPLTEVGGFVWAPDGRAIWFATGGSLPRELWKADLAGNRLERHRTGVSPTPSPDGRWLALLDFHPFGIYLEELSSGTVRFLGQGNPVAWSPDSRYLAYTDTIGRAWQVFVYDALEHTSTHVAPRSPFSYWPSWLPDSRHLVFSRCAGGKAGAPAQICIANIDGSNEVAVSDGPWDEDPTADRTTGAILFHRRDIANKHLTTVYLIAPGGAKQATSLGEGREPAFLHLAETVA